MSIKDSSDYEETCGLKYLNLTNSFGQWNSVKNQQSSPTNCANPWFRDYVNSTVGNNEFSCAFYRPFDWPGSHTMWLGQEIKFRTGYLIYDDNSEVQPIM